MILRRFSPVLFFLLTSVCAAPAVSIFKPLSESEIREVKAALEAMKKDPRGPFLRIRWFCKDGTVQAPPGNPCLERGGGVQYAERNPVALRLAGLQFDVGVILRSLTYDEFLDAADDYNLPKQMVLHDYLYEIDDGWIYRRARYYRGARQIEDEERQGQLFMEGLLADTQWLDGNFLLARRLAGVTPHQTIAPQTAVKIRNTAQEIADAFPDFQPLRVKIHSHPSSGDLAAIEKFLGDKRTPAELRGKISELRDLVGQLYDPQRWAGRLERYVKRLPGSAEEIAKVQKTLAKDDPEAGFRALAGLAVQLRSKMVAPPVSGSVNLHRMDLLLLLQDKAFAVAQEIRERNRTRPRRERVQDLGPYFDLAYADGLLSGREREALEREIADLASLKELTALEYKNRIGYLSRSLDWSRSALRGVFEAQVERYAPVEPKTAGFLDAQIRSSILLPLSIELSRLAADADAELGQSHVVAGFKVSQGVRGLNPGVARGILEIVERMEPDWLPDPAKIYVLPDTIADLKPMAGILTLDAGNLLSHAQLLARNLGIPNAALSPSLLVSLRQCQGKEVFFAVTPLGLVTLKEVSQLTPEELALVREGPRQPVQKVSLDTARLILDRSDPIPLRELGAADSGRLAGPKAANLGELARHFPDQVAAGVVLPFGMYRRHIDRPFDSPATLESEIRGAYQTADQMARSGRPEQEINDFMLPKLARFRAAIEQMPWDPASRQAVLKAIRAAFSEQGVRRGIFIRSDTNAEDLPQFSGAGLNLTIPNQRTEQDILDSIKKVWASPFSERAYLWRRQLLANQEDIYASVLLLESVPSDKSGVLITSGLEAGSPEDLTVVAAQGVGGVVEGASAETVLVRPDGSIQLLSQAKAPYCRILDKAGGVAVVPTRKTDTLLSPGDIAALRETVARWKNEVGSDQRYTVWDIEFGFVGAKLWLFQVRPFVGHRDQRLLKRLELLDLDVERASTRKVSLKDKP